MKSWRGIFCLACHKASFTQVLCVRWTSIKNCWIWCCNVSHPHSYDYNKPLSNVQLELINLQSVSCSSQGKSHCRCSTCVLCLTEQKRFHSPGRATSRALLFGPTWIIKHVSTDLERMMSTPFHTRHLNFKNATWFDARWEVCEALFIMRVAAAQSLIWII